MLNKCSYYLGKMINFMCEVGWSWCLVMCSNIIVDVSVMVFLDQIQLVDFQ